MRTHPNPLEVRRVLEETRYEGRSNPWDRQTITDPDVVPTGRERFMSRWNKFVKLGEVARVRTQRNSDGEKKDR